MGFGNVENNGRTRDVALAMRAWIPTLKAKIILGYIMETMGTVRDVLDSLVLCKDHIPLKHDTTKWTYFRVQSRDGRMRVAVAVRCCPLFFDVHHKIMSFQVCPPWESEGFRKEGVLW